MILLIKKKLEKEDKYIEKLTNKLSEKINKDNGDLLNIYNNDKESVLKFVKNIYINIKMLHYIDLEMKILKKFL